MTAMTRRDPKSASDGGRLGGVDLSARLSKQAYEKRLKQVQHELRRLQLAYRASGDRGIVVLEGWDAAGKGGVIRRMTSVLDPRACKVWPIAAPSRAEHGRHYLYRFWKRLPEPGTIAVFDRSWYGRVLVERVDGLAEEAAWRRAYDEINAFERMLRDDGVNIAKLFLHISADEQLKRFAARIEDPLKRWKLTMDDIRNRQNRPAYTEAVEDMLRLTDTQAAPWRVVAAEDKRHGRIEVIEAVLATLTDDVPPAPTALAPEVAEAARDILGLDVDMD